MGLWPCGEGFEGGFLGGDGEYYGGLEHSMSSRRGSITIKYPKEMVCVEFSKIMEEFISLSL